MARARCPSRSAKADSRHRHGAVERGLGPARSHPAAARAARSQVSSGFMLIARCCLASALRRCTSGSFGQAGFLAITASDLFRRRQSVARRDHQRRALLVIDRCAVPAQAEALENAAKDFGVDRHVVIAGAGRGAGRKQGSASRQPSAARETARRLNLAAKPVGRIGHPIPYAPEFQGDPRSEPDHCPGSGRFLGALPGQGFIQQAHHPGNDGHIG